MARPLWSAVIGAGLLATAAAAAAQQPQDRSQIGLIRHLFGMDLATFKLELARRFQYPPPQPSPAVVDDIGAGQALDAAYFQSFANFDRSYSPAAGAEAKRLAGVLAREARALTHEQFVLRIAEIAALADNAHTSIGENALRKNTARLPLRTFLFADGLYVLRADPTHAALLGARIIAIDGRNIEEIYRALARYLPGPERRRRLKLLPVLESPGLLHAAGLAAEPLALTLTLRLGNGETVERRIEAEQRGPAAPVMNTIRLLYLASENEALAGLPFPKSAIPLYLAERRQLFTLAELPERGLYIGLTHNDDGDEAPLAPFLSSALQRVKTGQPLFVVVDMRMNGGGDYTTTYDFARALPATASGAPIYVLTSSWTFSAAITTVAALKDAGKDQVLIVGEQAGDRLAFWAEGGAFELPNSAVPVHYSAGRHDYGAPCTDRRICFWLNEIYPVRVDDIEPDIHVPLTFEGWRAGRDSAIEAILARERATDERG